MKRQVIAMVMVGGRGTRLAQITNKTAKPAVSFGGKFKLIDFVLSNLSNSNIDTAGIITQYEPHELMSYIGRGSTWDLDVSEGGISFLTPYTSSDGELWQKGTAHAINQHFRYIDQYNPDYVLILSGDHIYKMDYNKLIKEHIKTKADITISAFSVSKDASRFGILQLDNQNKVIDFEEKPDTPKSSLASMGIYVFNKKVLKSLLQINLNSNFDFGKDIIPLALKKDLNVFGYRFRGYFKDVGTVKSLFKANMDLIDNPHYLKLHEYKDSPVYTKSSNLPPHHVASNSILNSSLISDGCLIYGDIYHSIISSGVVIRNHSRIKDCIIHQNVIVGEHCKIQKAIIVENTYIPPQTVLEFKKVTIIDNDFIKNLGDNNE